MPTVAEKDVIRTIRKVKDPDTTKDLISLGRIKELINRGGEKLSPVDLDAAIEAVPGVRAAAAFAIAHRSLGEEIAAAVVRDGNVAIQASDIIDHVRRRMGPTRVPRHIYFVDELPRTDSSKIRRSDLPRLLGLDQPDVTSATIGSRVGKERVIASPLETVLAGLWASVLQAERIELDDDFFVLGGDSLSGARLLARVKAVLGVDLSIESLFQGAATVAGMARAIENVRISRRR